MLNLLNSYKHVKIRDDKILTKKIDKLLFSLFPKLVELLKQILWDFYFVNIRKKTNFFNPNN